LADTATRTMLVYRRSGATSGFDDALELAADQLLGSPLLPGLSLSVGDLLPAA
jgi:Uma2 family endonuclease